MRIGVDIDCILTNDDDYILDFTSKYRYENNLNGFDNANLYEHRKLNWNENIINDYREFKKQLSKKEQKLEKTNNQTKELDNTSKDINEILNNLKPTLMNKNNMVISNEDVQKTKKYTEDVKD